MYEGGWKGGRPIGVQVQVVDEKQHSDDRTVGVVVVVAVVKDSEEVIGRPKASREKGGAMLGGCK